MNMETQELFASAMRDVSDGPLLGSFRGLTRDLLRRLSEKGLTLEQCAGRKMLNRSVATLQGHCREFGIRFPDYTPSNMRKHVKFVQRGDFLELSGSEVEAVAKALGIVVQMRGKDETCAVPAHAFDDTKEALRSHGYVAKKAKPAKKPKAVAHA